jgi:hypothetical protein
MRTIIFLLIAGCSFAQDLKFTDNLANGRFWMEMRPEGKLTYLIGATDGARQIIGYIQSMCFKETTFQKQDACKKTSTEVFELYFKAGNTLTRGEMIEEIDAFYKEPLNRLTPIIEALAYVTAKSNGASKDALEQLELLGRRSGTQ